MNRSIKACYFNARSIRNKITDLEELIFSEDYGVVGITESWIDTTKRDFLAEFAFPGFSLFNSERPKKAGGGVLLYIKSHFHPVLLSKRETDDTNLIFVQLKHQSRKVVIGLVYRPPSQARNIDDELFEKIAEISSQYESIIMGDFNISVANWGDELTTHSGNALYENLQESSLYQHVNHPTKGNKILDLVFTTCDNLVNNVQVGTEFSNSDHRVINFNINVNDANLPVSKEKVLDYRRADFEKLRHSLANINWTDMTESNDIDVAWQKFTGKLNLAVQSSIPMRYRRSHKNLKPKWWTRDIKIKLAQKKRAYEKYRETNSQDDKLEHDRIRRHTKKLIRQNKRSYEIHVAAMSKSNPKEFFSYVKKKKVTSASIGPLETQDGEQTNNEEKMANTLNIFFASVFTKESTLVNPPTPASLNNGKCLNSFNYHENDVALAIDKMNVNKSPGPDQISPRILKEAKNEIVKPLTILFNLSLRTGIVPNDWKLANVTPIFKKGCKSQPGNYRPISLTSIVCKLMESVIRDKIITFLETNDIIKDSQHGFRNKRSCLSNLLDFYNDVFQMYDDTRAVDVIYLDFQKAFDKVPHRRLISKVKAHGITGNLSNWIENWLSDRKQRVVINGKSSDWTSVNSGVPQGSVLGPVLFIIYINDIDENITCRISKFADDTKITNTVCSEQQRLCIQNDLNTLSRWSEDWQMSFNIDKCHVLHIGSHNPNVNYVMNHSELKSVDEEKDLGVIISKNLKPHNQISKVVKTANKLVGFIGRTFSFKSEKVILTLYNSLVRPHLEYCVQFWSPYYKKDIEKLEKIQRRVTKMIPRLRNKSYENRLKDLDLFSLSKRRLRGDLIEVFKMFNGYTNINPEKLFTRVRSNSTRNHGFKITGKRFSTTEAKYFFTNRIVNIWNNLPFNVVNATTIETFKNRLDRYFITNPRLSLFITE